jgi:hypothetical protein
MLMTKTRLFAAVAAIVFLQAGSAHAQAAKTYESIVGHWKGSVDTPQGGQEVQIIIDSTATGLHGSSLAPAMGNDPVDFSAISVKADTIMLSLNVGAEVTFSGWINPDTHLFEGALFIGADNSGTFSFKREVAAAAAAPKKPRI